MTTVGPRFGIERRALLQGGIAFAGGLALPVVASHQISAATARSLDVFAPNAFIRIDRRGEVTLVMPMTEMGQGIFTALSMLLAEELEVGLDQVRLEMAPANDALYANPALRTQLTGGSASVRGFWVPLRQAGAAARTLLVTAAAQRWHVDPSTCRAEQGAVFDRSGGRHLGYGDLVAAAAHLPVPAPGSVPLKSPASFKIISSSTRRIEAPAKINGEAMFGMDVKVPGLKIAAIAISPVMGGKPNAVNEAAALAVKGVRQVVRTGEAVAVVGDHMWAAMKGLKAAAIVWDDGPNASVDSAGLLRQLEEASRKPGAVARNEGDVKKAFAGAAQRLEAVYQLPFLAHAAMEPLNCTVDIGKDGCDVWVGTQAPTRVQAVAAEVTGLPRRAIKVHTQLLGGAFGRHLETDSVVLAIKVARQVQGPVKVVWTREEDTRHGMYRPYYYDRVAAGLDATGKPVAWTHRIAGSSVLSRVAPSEMRNGVDRDAVFGAARPPYALPNIKVDFVRVEPRGVPTGFWRGVGATHNIFVVESFIDELAHLAKADPVAYRVSLLGQNPRALAVLKLAAERAGWGRALQPGWGRGVSVQFAFGSYAAMVAEVERLPNGELKVRRLVCAVDCGFAVNPDGIAAQIEGGALYGLTAVLRGEITLRNGRVEQGNFDTYPPLRIEEAPRVETHIVKSAELPSGIGETATAIVGPAVTNAIFAATGKRVRTLPVERALAAL